MFQYRQCNNKPTFFVGSLLSKKSQDPLDAVLFAIGVQTVLRQYTFSAMTRYVKYLCAYVLSCVAPDRYKHINILLAQSHRNGHLH